MQQVNSGYSIQVRAKIVDELLNSPEYGERWGRHWMDVWRYSDWDGFKDELRGSQRHIWHWRDWIVESLNDNKPYDRMIVEMLAATRSRRTTCKPFVPLAFWRATITFPTATCG